MPNLEETATKITIKDGTAIAYDKDDSALLVISSDELAQQFFSKSRMPIAIYEMSLRWMSQSHFAFIHERPPQMISITVNEKLYYIPIPWSITGTVISSETGKINYSRIFFTQSQLSYEDQELFFCEIPCVGTNGITFREGQHINISDPDEISSTITSTYILSNRNNYRIIETSRSVLHDDIYNKFLNGDTNKFDHDAYLQELSELSLKDGLYVQRKTALTLGDMIEQVDRMDRELNSSFYEEKDSFNFLLNLMDQVNHRNEMMMEYEDEPEDEEPEEDQEEPF